MVDSDVPFVSCTYFSLSFVPSSGCEYGVVLVYDSELGPVFDRDAVLSDERFSLLYEGSSVRNASRSVRDFRSLEDLHAVRDHYTSFLGALFSSSFQDFSLPSPRQVRERLRSLLEEREDL